MSRLMSVAAGAVVAAALSFGSAYAAPASVTLTASSPNDSGTYQTRAATVDVGDTASADGAAALLARIDAAARAVCGEKPGKAMNERRASLFTACRTRVVRYAVQEVDAPELTKLAASH